MAIECFLFGVWHCENVEWGEDAGKLAGRVGSAVPEVKGERGRGAVEKGADGP